MIGLPNGLDQRNQATVLGKHRIDQQPGANIFAGIGVHGPLFCERMRDQLGVTPQDQRVGRCAGTWQIAPGGRIQQGLHPDRKGAGQLCVMVCHSLDGLGICGACCD